MKGFIIATIAILIVAGSLILMAIGISNHEIKLRQRGDAQQEIMKVSYDEMYKIVAQNAQVTKEYAKQFKDIFVEIMEARYDNQKGGLMSWIQEQNPNFDSQMYQQLVQNISAERIKFANAQKLWVDIDREHKTYRKVWPNKYIIGNRPDLEGDIVTSTVTEKVFETGKDDDIDLGF